MTQMTTQTRSTFLVASYFNQGEQYYSASKGALIPIATMPPAYAANAAEALTRSAEHWHAEAGGITGAVQRRPYAWIRRTKLIAALEARGEDQREVASELVETLSQATRRQIR
jgi:hypothetical protein